MEQLTRALYQNLIEKDRYMYIVRGLGVTMEITLMAIAIGVVIGFIVAIVRSTHDKTGNMKVLNAVCQLYLTVIRGTPVMVQLLIMYYIVLTSVRSKIVVAGLAFGINSGAYVAEIVRGGIQSIDNGQFEAGRSLGFNYIQTMWYIILPQVFKSVLPALANEAIALLKETSICGYIGLMDLTRGGDIIRSRTYEAFFPLIVTAGIYFILAWILSLILSRVEISINPKRSKKR